MSWRSHTTLRTLILALIFAHWGDQSMWTVNGDVTCYVCSWSRSDTLNDSSVVRDTCSPGNFVPSIARQVECGGGCETMTYRTWKSGPVRHFHRNCVAVKTDRVFQDRCDNYMGNTQFEEKCECFSSFCNSSPVGLSWSKFVINFVPMTITVSSRVSFNSLLPQNL